MPEEPVYAFADQYHAVGVSDAVDAPERPVREIPLSARLRQRWAGLFRRTVSPPAGAAMFEGTAGALLDALSDWVCGLDATGRISAAFA